MNFRLLFLNALLWIIPICGSNDLNQLARSLEAMSADASIISYNALRDRSALMDILKPDALLLAGEATHVDNAMIQLGYMLDHKSPYPDGQNPEYDGALSIDVYRDNGKTVGVVTYWKDAENPVEGKIIVVAIDKDYRRRGYAEKLFQHAIKYFKEQPVKLVDCTKLDT